MMGARGRMFGYEGNLDYRRTTGAGRLPGPLAGLSEKGIRQKSFLCLHFLTENDEPPQHPPLPIFRTTWTYETL